MRFKRSIGCMHTEKSTEVKKIKLLIEYDGEDFCGWQKQLDPNTIQGRLEEALQLVEGKRSIIYGAGRTDSGVHAAGQVAHFFTDKAIEPKKWPFIFNSRLPSTIRVLRAEYASDKFHSQKSATSKLYEYRIENSRVQSALDRRVYFCPPKLDWCEIEKALPHFVGTHDFASFQGAKASVKTTVRTVTRFELIRKSDTRYHFEVEGTGFLKQMVRTMVGTVVEVGEGKRKASDIPHIIQACDRRAAGRTAPAQGLFLVRVDYPAE